MENMLEKVEDHLIEELSIQAIKVITSNCSNENLVKATVPLQKKKGLDDQQIL